MHGSTGGSRTRSTLATPTEVAQPFGKPAEHRPGAYQSATATAPAPDPTNLEDRRGASSVAWRKLIYGALSR